MVAYYILDGKNVVPADAVTWARWFEKAADKRVVAKTVIGDKRVSTVFLGNDHGYGGGPREIFETMVFGNDDWLDEYCERYATWKEAEAGHAKAIEITKQAMA